MPPEARAKGEAAKARAKAAFFLPFWKARAKGEAAKARAKAVFFLPFWPGRLRPREDEYTVAGMLIITTMKPPWRPLASLLKAICSVPYITSHPASEAV